MRLMIISDCYPADLTNGKHLRVFNLCRQLCERFDCYFVGLSQGENSPMPENPLPFREIAAHDARERGRIPWWRWFRLSNAHYIRESSPDYYESAVRRLHELADEWQIDATVTFEARLAEVSIKLDLPRVLDYPDCSTLSIERRLANRSRTMGFGQRLSLQLRKLRNMHMEKYFLTGFDQTITISEQDRLKLRDVSGVADDDVCVVPNGVSTELYGQPDQHTGTRKRIVFWGNLDFPPNWTAVNYFYDHVFEPFLAPEGIEWHIVGAGADSRIREIGKHEQVILAGFRSNLTAYMAGMDAMVNPMVEGGGLKNKVLEAFAMKLPVVSTTMGAEAINCEANVHFARADSPEEFASQVRRVLNDRAYGHKLADNGINLVRDCYGWSAVGNQYADIVDAAVNGVKQTA